LLAGYGIAIPVGAIGVLIVNTGLRRGFGPGFMAGAGVATADFLYAALVALTGGALSSALAPFTLSLRIGSALVLLALGSYGLWRAREITGRRDARPTVWHGYAPLRTYARFLGLTLMNPLTVAYFAALMLANGAVATVMVADHVIFAVGAGLASLTWQTLLAAIGALGRRSLSPQFQRYTGVVGNLVVIGWGLRVVVQILAQHT
jgi:threonine/homoserine/homoserine lactone efflux protein